MSRGYYRGYSEPSIMNGILFFLISMALTVVIAAFPGKALFEWIHQGLIRLAFDGELIGYEPASLLFILLLPIIGTTIINIACFQDSCDRDNWITHLIIIVPAALILSLGMYAVALVILFLMLLPLIRCGIGLERIYRGFSRILHPSDAMDAAEQLAKDHPGILLHEMLCDEEHSWFRDTEDDEE